MWTFILDLVHVKHLLKGWLYCSFSNKSIVICGFITQPGFELKAISLLAEETMTQNEAPVNNEPQVVRALNISKSRTKSN